MQSFWLWRSPPCCKSFSPCGGGAQGLTPGAVLAYLTRDRCQGAPCEFSAAPACAGVRRHPGASYRGLLVVKAVNGSKAWCERGAEPTQRP